MPESPGLTGIVTIRDPWSGVLDVDATLTPTSSGQHLAELVGNAKEIAEMQAGYGAGPLSSDVGTHLCSRYGFDRACGPRLQVVDGRYSGEVAEQFDEHAKRDFAVRVAAELGVDLRHWAAIGDGRSDVPLFGVVGCAIAFNATPEAPAAASATVNGPDFHAVVPALGAWLETIALPVN